MSGEQTRHYNLMISLPLAGLISGVLTICVISIQRRLFPVPTPFLIGGVFGVVIGGFLAKTKVMRNEGWAWLVLAATVAHFIAYLSAYSFQLFSASEKHRYVAHPDSPWLSSLVVGGLAGGFVLVGLIGAFLLVRKERDFDSVIFMTLLGAVCGGGLAAIGYGLGPSLGNALWRILETSRLIGAGGPSDTITDFGEANLMYALYLVWQTGMAFVIALMLRNRKPLGESNGSHP